MTLPFTPTALSGRVIAVTGADHGYGRLVSQALARSGASVVMIGGNAETLAAAASALEQYGGEIIPLKADVSVPLDFISAQERILEIFGGLHGVVHLADRRASTTFTLLTENEWMELFNCNVKSTVGIAQIIARRLPGTWLTVIGPHLDEVGLQVFPQRGAIQGLVQQAHTNDLRVNLILPGRASSGEEALDAPVADAVLALATTWLQNLRGNVMEIPLAPAPKVRLPDLQYL